MLIVALKAGANSPEITQQKAFREAQNISAIYPVFDVYDNQ